MDLLDDLLALLAGGNASVRVVKKGSELLLLLEVGLVSAGENVVSDDGCESDDESSKRSSLPKVLGESSLARLLNSAKVEHRRHGEHGLCTALSHTLLLKLVGVLSEHGHGNIVRASHCFSGRND